MITLKGQPLSTNHIYKHTCRGRFASVYMSSDGKALKENYIKQLSKQWKEEIIKDELSIHYVLYFGDKRKRDIDNHLKIIQDSLSGIVFEDDSQIKELYVRKEYDHENPRVDIEIMQL
jgi:Holliday junction resolvase RusA-like endonuclease